MKRQTGAFGFSLLPILLWMVIQAVVILVLGHMITGLGEGISFLGGNPRGLYRFWEENYSSLSNNLANILTLIPAGLWYRRLQAGKKEKKKGFFGLSPLWILLLPAAGLALQLLSGWYLRLVFAVFPEWLRYYTYVLENLGMTEPAFLPLLYTIVLAPVTEELIFRGLSMKILEMEFPFWAANILQALYFGAVHGNMVQGIYGFLSGLALGYLVKRKGTLAAGVLCHFGVNLSGVLLGLL